MRHVILRAFFLVSICTCSLAARWPGPDALAESSTGSAAQAQAGQWGAAQARALAAQRPPGLRRLMQEALKEEPYIINSADDFYQAILAHARHLEFRTHLDRRNTGAPPPPAPASTTDDTESMARTSQQAVAGNVTVYRGNCSEPPSDATFDLKGSSLLSPAPGQCLLVYDIKLAHTTDSVLADPFWYDNMYMRFELTEEEAETASPMMFISHNAYVTSTTFQGSGPHSPACRSCGWWIYGNVYAEGLRFADFHGDRLFTVASGASFNMVGGELADNSVDGALLTVEDGGVASVSRSLLSGNVAPAPFRTLSWTNSSDSFFCDAAMPVLNFEDAAGRSYAGEGESAPLDTRPANRFLRADDSFFVNIAEGAMQSLVAPPMTRLVQNDFTGPPTASSDSLSRGAIAGIAIACIVAAAAAAAAGFVLLRRRRGHKADTHTPLDTAAQQEEGKAGQVRPQLAHSASGHSQQSPGTPLPQLPLGSDRTASTSATGSTLASSGAVSGPWQAEDVTINYSAAGVYHVTHDNRGMTTGFTTMGDSAALSNLSDGDTPPDRLLQAQLEWLISHKGGRLLDYLKMAAHLGRRVGGQGAVVFAQHVNAPARQFACKFFLRHDAFLVEKAAACSPALRAAMPPVALIEDSPAALAAAVKDMPGRLKETPLPPLIVTEKGESLDEFVARSAPDFITCLQVLLHLAGKLEGLHAEGWVHRDLKPNNAIWLPSSNSWTLIDFGSSARVGEQADMSITVKYAAPELVQAYQRGDKTIVADPAVDVWAFGLMCFELLTRSKFYGPLSSMEAVVSQLSGDAPLPTEVPLDPKVEACLGSGTFRQSILSMLSRDPSQRPSVAELIGVWNGAVFAQPVVPQSSQSLRRTDASSTASAQGTTDLPYPESAKTVS